MTAPEIYREAIKLGLQIEVAGEQLAIRPVSRCPAEFKDILRQHKGELLDWLNRPPCHGWQAVPPANLTLNTAMPRPTPGDRERVISYMRRQGCDRPGPLTAWLVRRENAYYEGPGRHWDCGIIAYAAARDAAGWQLNRTEGEVLDFIQASQTTPHCQL